MTVTRNIAKLWRCGCLRLAVDESGQDMIEYALLAAALVVIIAGCLPTAVIPIISTTFSRICSSMNGV